MNKNIKDFFSNSSRLDYLVLRPLDHICGNWELTWNETRREYERENDSFAGKLNKLILELANTIVPENYHHNEDRLANNTKNYLEWSINKIGNKWNGEDYDLILEQGGFHDDKQSDLIESAVGRVQAAIDRGQLHFDDMEEGHRNMLAIILYVILYHRMN